MEAINLKSITLNKPYNHISDKGRKRVNKLWINSHYKLNDNYYNSCVEINLLSNQVKINWIIGYVNNIEYNIELNSNYQQQIINNAFEYAVKKKYIQLS